MKKSFYTIYIVLLFVSSAYSQLLVENFDYTAGTNLTDNGWTAHSGAGTNPITVSSGGLSYTGYASSGVGNAALVDNTGEDVNKGFTAQTSGTVYYSFLFNVTAVANGYFMHLKDSGFSYCARVFLSSSGAGFNVGISNSSTAVLGSTVYDLNTTYLAVVSYNFTTTDCKLWVFSSGVPSTEVQAGTPEATSTGSGLSSISTVALRQYNAGQNITIDGIRVGTTWDTAPLPVELTSFTAASTSLPAGESNVILNWQTATEVDNYGFEIERANVKMLNETSPQWQKIGFVEGAGNSNSSKFYSYIDDEKLNGTYQYRLKQIDIDGQFKYSDIVEIEVNSVPAKFNLAQNYPNPFNPSTVIQYSIPAVDALNPVEVHVSLIVYDILGNEAATLVSKKQSAGNYQVEFNGSQLASGVYLYRLQTSSGFIATKKLMLLK